MNAKIHNVMVIVKNHGKNIRFDISMMVEEPLKSKYS